MIDIENKVFDKIYTKVSAAYPEANITSEYVREVSTFPHVSIVEISNTVYRNASELSRVECMANITYEVNVYSNELIEKKQQCKEIIALIDETMASMGFIRTFLNPVQNMEDATIYRMTGRWQIVTGGI